MGAAVLAGMITGRITVRIGLRTARGIEPVAAGVLAGGDATGNTLQIVDEITRQLRTVTLTSAHVIAYRTSSTEMPGRAAA